MLNNLNGGFFMKTKRIVAWLLTFLMVLGVMPARVVMADSALVDAETKLEFTIEGDKATITGYSGNKDELKELVVPEVVTTEDGSSCDVSAIAAGAFSYDQYPNLDSIAVLGSDVVIGEKMCGFKPDGTRNDRLILWVTPGSTFESYAKSELFKPNNLATAISDITDTRGEQKYIYTETSGFEVNAELTVGTIYGETEEKLDIADVQWTSEHPNAVSVVPKSYEYDAQTGKIKAAATVKVNSLEGIEDSRSCVIKATTKSGLEKSITISNILKSATGIQCECKIYKEIKTVDPVSKRITAIEYLPVDETLLATDADGNFTYFKDDTLTIDEGYVVSFRPYVTGSAVGEGEEEDFIRGCLVDTSAPYSAVYEFGGYDASNQIITGAPVHLSDNKDDYVYKMNDATGKKSSITFVSSSNVLSKKINIDIKRGTTDIEISLGGTKIGTGTGVIAGYKGNLSYKLNASNKTSTDTAVWSVDDKNKASVSSAGVLEANQDGTVNITCTVEDTLGFKRNISKTIILTIIKKVEYQKIGLATSLDGEAVQTVDVQNGSTVTVYPVETAQRTDGKIPNEYVTYTSSNPNVAKVDENGVISGKSVGTATITVNTVGTNSSASIAVNVFAPITEIKLAEEAGAIPQGQTKVIKYTKNQGATDKVIWQSLDKSIATVECDEEEGKISITAVALGQTNIEGYAKNNEEVKKITQVTVIPAVHIDTLGIKVADEASYTDTYVSEEEDTKGITVYEVERGKSIVFQPDYLPINANDGLTWEHIVKEGTTAYATGTIVGTQLTVRADRIGGIEVFKLVSTNGKAILVGVKPVVKATSIEIRKGNTKIESVNVVLDKTTSVKANILPADSTDDIEWTAAKDQDGNDIISINKSKTGKDEELTITGLKAGVTTLTATAKSGVKATITVNVIIPTTEIIFKDGEQVVDPQKGLAVYKEVSKTVNIEVVPNDTTDTKYSWSSNNPAVVVTPLDDGKSAVITAHSSVTATITVTATESNGSFPLLVKALIPAEEISFTCTKTSINKNGAAVVAISSILPATSNDIINYTVDKEGIVEIEPNPYDQKRLTIKGIEVGTVVITATTGSGKSASITIDVATVDMASDDIVVSGINNSSQYTYTGEEIKAQNLSVRCTSNAVNLVEGTDYELKYENNVNVTNEAKLTITGKGNYSGEKVITFKILPKSGNSSDVTAVFDETKTAEQLKKIYDGNVLKPTVTVTDSKRAENETILINAVDYDIEYSNASPVNQGTYYVTIKFKGNYTGQRQLSYVIQRKNISDLEDGTKVVSVIGLESQYAYTGVAINPAVTVKDLSRNVELKLGADKDYVVSYANNVNSSTDAAKGTITITGCGNYQGTVTCNFEIVPASLSKASIVPINNSVYTGSAIVPAVTLKIGDKIIPSSYYDVKYTNNVKTGKATVTVTGKGNYSGRKSTTFKILPTQVANLKQTSATNTSVKLSWSKNPKGQAVSGYYIYKVDTSRNRYTKIGSTTKNYFTVSKLKAGSNYTYAVAAQKSGYVGAYSQIVTAMTSASKVSIRSIKATGNGAVNIKWRAVKGATSYKIYTSTNGKKYKLAATTSFTEHTLIGLRARKRIYVKIVTIRNINGKDYKSSYSSTKNVVVK